MTPTQKIKRIDSALAKLAEHEVSCRLCPRECGVNRAREEKGFCQSGNEAAVSHALLHYGEEPVLSGYRDCARNEGGEIQRRAGSGTIFFTGCNLKCSFCQNYQLSWLNQGKGVSDEGLARMMLGLERRGALNINLVSPSHLLLPILRALRIAYARGLSLPLVYNANGYEKVDIIMNLDEIIDIYLPDLKYFSAEVSEKFSGSSDYFKHASLAIKEMSLQRPVLVLDRAGIAKQGLIIRHLVLPGQTTDSFAVLEWLAAELSTHTCISLMSQFHPCYRAPEELRRPLRPEEYQAVLTKAQELRFENMFVQPEAFRFEDHLVPDFSLVSPFSWGGKREDP
jgi:putative pyruvate formate lyase activating enzyme